MEEKINTACKAVFLSISMDVTGVEADPDASQDDQPAENGDEN